MIICKVCGSINKDGKKICKNCFHPLRVSECGSITAEEIRQMRENPRIDYVNLLHERAYKNSLLSMATFFVPVLGLIYSIKAQLLLNSGGKLAEKAGCKLLRKRAVTRTFAIIGGIADIAACFVYIALISSAIS